MTYSQFLLKLRQVVRNDHLILVLLALVAGAIAGGAVVAFREGIDMAQTVFYGSGSERLFSSGAPIPWWNIVLAPTLGGLIVGGLVHMLMPDRRAQGVADVIEANALNSGAMSSRVGVAAAVISAVSIGAGASVGREGPAVHLGASLAGWLGRRLGLRRALTRTLLGCGVASAVAASFNAPIAGALFANEVVIGHYALKAFAPIVIASVAGTAISRVWFGNFPAFALTESMPLSVWEFPAFVGLGITAAIAAIVFMRSVAIAGRLAEKAPLPTWLRPAAAGLVIGIIALEFPQVLGVGYGTTEQALLVAMPLSLLIAVGVAKIAATAISLGWGFGGGLFSPSLVIGAMVGGAYGIIATSVFPEYSSGASAYTIVGMGAVAAAVLGAPISTTLIVFEMTSDYTLTLGVMIAVVISSTITQQFYGRSFFMEQLKERGINLKEGYEAEIMRAIRVRDVVSQDCQTVSPDAGIAEIREKLQKSRSGELFVVNPSGELYGTVTFADLSDTAFDPAINGLVRAGDVAQVRPLVVAEDDDLEAVLGLMSGTGEQRIAAVDNAEKMTFKGCVYHGDVMAAYNRALLASRHEEHGV